MSAPRLAARAAARAGQAAVRPSSKNISPRFLVPTQPSLGCQRRNFLTRRSTSFWTHSFPPQLASTSSQSPFVPSVPPTPGQAGHVESSRQGQERASGTMDGRKKQRKQRYLDSLMDKAGELSLRCSIIDAEGNWRAEEGRYKKAELCKEYDLDPRDLRKLDSLSPNLVPIILTRRSCILISMLHIRALIQPERVIVFDTAGTVESEVQRRFKWHLERNVRAAIKAKEQGADGDEEMLAYEHRALESILVATANALEEEMAFTRRLVQQLLADLEDDINRDNLKRLLHYSRRIVGFQSRARYVKRAVDEVLDNDEDLSAMYLTARAQGKPRAVHDHEQLELLLESFTKQVEEIVSEVDTTVANVQSTQEIAELMLDSGRNALLALDVKISIATLGVGTGALIAGFFGMNLTTELEQSPYAFYAVTGSAAFLAAVVFVFGLRIMRRVRRVALTGPVPRRRFLIFRRQPPPAEISWNDFPLYMPGTDHLTGGPRVNSSAVTTVNVLKKKLAIWDWLFRRRNAVPSARVKWMRTQKVKSGAAEPVWINQQADQARARDAMRGQQMEAEQGRLRRAEGGPEDKAWEERMKAIEKIREGRLKAWDMGLWEPGCEGVWTSGRGKPKWAKD